MAVKPRHSLKDVRDAIKKRKVLFTAESRSVLPVQQTYERLGKPKDGVEAQWFILDGIKKLTERHFFRSSIQWDDPTLIADIFGLIYDGLPWYIKFMLTEECILEEISFHPPERKFKTVGGILIPKGEV